MSQASAEVIRDPKYYFSDGSTVFLVENVLFKVCQ